MCVFLGKVGELHTRNRKVQIRHFVIKFLRQEVDLVLVGLKQHDRSVINGEDEHLLRIYVVDFYAFTPSEPKCPVLPKIALFFNIFMCSRR